MDYNKFMKRNTQRPKPKISFTAPCNISWIFRQEIAEMTKDIDYICGFDSGGLCKTMRKDNSINLKCCCINCHNTFGYLMAIPASEDGSIEREIINLFDETDGFWRKRKGCILPRKYRSLTCLSYMCMSWKLYKTLPQKDRLVLHILRRPTRHYLDYVKLLKERKIRSVNDFIDTIISGENSICKKGGM